MIIICDGSNSGEIFQGFDGVLASTMGKIKYDEKLDSSYLRIFLILNFSLFNSKKTGSAIPHLDQKFLYSLEIPLPPLPEQQRIVTILDEAFAAIEIAKKNTEKNLQNAKEIFESYLQSIFTIENNTPLVQIGAVAKIFDGPHATPKTIGTGPIFLGISALQDGYINLQETRHVTPEDFQKWTRRVSPQPNDIVFSYETRLGQAALIPEGLECCLGRRMGLLRLDQKKVNPQFFIYQYVSPPFRNYLKTKTVRGATVDRIWLKDMPNFQIILPTLLEQEKIAVNIDNLRSETKKIESLYQQKLSDLEELKKSLLKKAFNGEL